MKSQPSPTETGLFLSSEIYRLGDFPDIITISDIELDTYLFNTRTLRSYDTSLIAPIPESLRGSGIGDIGRKPFVINLRMRAEGEDATFEVSSTEFYLEGSNKTLFPKEIFIDRRNPGGCAYDKIPSKVRTEVTEGLVPIFNKHRVLTDKGVESEDWSVPHWTCIQFRFDVPTPDPSTKFRLKLGEIVKPNGERIRPMIYFTPVTYKNYTH